MKSRCDLSVTNLIYPFAVSVQLFLSLFLHTFIIANYAVRVNRKIKVYANKILYRKILCGRRLYYRCSIATVISPPANRRRTCLFHLIFTMA